MDFGEVIKLLVVLVIVIVPAISQIVAKIREAQKPPAAPRVPRVPQARRPAEEGFKDEIEEFLRRAAEGRQAGQGGRAPARTGQAAQRDKAAAASKSAPPTDAQQPAQASSPTATVVEHVQKHLDTSEFGRRTTQMGGEVAQADDKLDARVQQVFEHQLSQFDWRTTQEIEAAGETVPLTATTAGAAGLAALLASPEGLRQAIVLNEVLQRPEHRWG
jgi:hypothetical protein